MKKPPSLLRQAREQLLRKLLALGVDETGNLIVAGVRKTRKNLVGYYSRMSQFRGRARIVADPRAIEAGLREMGASATVEEILGEVCRTVFHEYGHVMAEAIRHCGSMGSPFVGCDWSATFNGDEEYFAEDFARYLDGDPMCELEFWGEFMPRYAREVARLFGATVSAAPALAPAA